MNVFFTTPFAGKKRYQPYIDAIIAEVNKENVVITPENENLYSSSLGQLQKQGLNKNQAHYAFIRQGIASADVVIIEATEEDIRVGHEMTLALLFHKPTLVLAQDKDISNYITHDLLQGVTYKTIGQLQKIVRQFLKISHSIRTQSSMQTLDTSVDSLHSIALAKLRQLSKQEPGQFGQWARGAEKNPQSVAKEIDSKLGGLDKQDAWSVFAPIYNEDSPDYIQSGVADFSADVLAKYGVAADDLVVEAACGTAALSRQLSARGFSNILAFDSSRPMLSEAYKLCTNYPGIKLSESDINSLVLDKQCAAIVWTDYSTNFAHTTKQLAHMISQLAENIQSGGVMLMDVRTYRGWQIDFYSQPVTTFATERFQRIWINHQDRTKQTIDFDVYIRIKDLDGGWSSWDRESMSEHMWHLQEVTSVINGIPDVKLEAVYGDDFRKIDVTKEEPNLAYFVLRKQ